MTDFSPHNVVELEERGAVAIVRLNRPARLNAFTSEMHERILDAFDDCDADDSVQAVVLTGSGRAFCAGADLPAGTGNAPPDRGGAGSLRIYRSNKPVIAAINGPAAVVGVTRHCPLTSA